MRAAKTQISHLLARHIHTASRMALRLVNVGIHSDALVKLAARATCSQRDYDKTASLLSEITLTRNSAGRLAQCYLEKREFEKAIQICHDALELGISTLQLRRIQLQSMANIADVDAILEIIQRDADAPEQDANYLMLLYRYACAYAPQLAEHIVTRILTDQTASELQYSNLLMLTHDLIALGRIDEARELLPYHKHAVAPPINQLIPNELLQSQFHFARREYKDQFGLTNAALALQGLRPVQAVECEEPLYPANLLTEVEKSEATNEAPLISVLMTAYNCAETINYAATSILGQTHRRLELIIIDDGSTDGTGQILSMLTQKDSRVKLLRTPRNSGTYFAKNLGLKEAAGEYVTCQDADDWAHPQKLERLAAILATRPKSVAVYSQHARWSKTRGIQHRNGHYLRPDASSLMYRRATVLNRIGFYDSVRAGADGEYQFRMEKVFGRHSTHQLPELLNFVALSDRSLSGGGMFAINEFTGAFTRPRNDYRRAFIKWHEHGRNLRIDCNQLARPFPIPKEIEAFQIS